MKNLLLLFLFAFVWVCLLPLYPSVSVAEEKALPDEEYVVSAMLGMTSDLLPEEALKAIAVTVRTYTAYHGKVLPQGSKEDIARATSVLQADAVYNAVRDAVYATSGEVLTYSGKIINACFHLASYKNTAEGDAPYLKSVPTPDESSYNGFFGEKTISPQEIYLYGKGEILSVSYGADGKARAVEFEHGSVDAADFAAAFSLASSDFTVNSLPDGGYTVLTRGIGNGYGLSLYGAYLLAEEGNGYTDILYRYFTGVLLTRKT